MTDAPKENASTALYERRPVVWWAMVVLSIIGGLGFLVKACAVAVGP